MRLGLLIGSVCAACLLSMSARACEFDTDCEFVVSNCSSNPLSVIDLGAAATTFNVSGISSSLNNHNHVAGYVPGSNPKAEAAVYADGKVKLLGTLGGSFSYALGINNSGEVVGWSYLSGDMTLHAARFSTMRAPRDLGTLGGSTSTAHAVNNRGTIVGAADLPGDKETHAARFTHRGVVDLGTLGGSNSSADALNNFGQAVGVAELAGNNASHAALYPSHGGAPVDLGTLGGNSSAANGVNDAGFAVGYSSVPLGGVLHAAVFMSWAAPIDLGGAQSEARGINQAGDIVGYATFGGQPHAALWTYAGGTWSLTDLNTLIDPNSGWTIDFAHAINNRGTVEAVGHRSDLQEHTLLLVRCAGRNHVPGDHEEDVDADQALIDAPEPDAPGDRLKDRPAECDLRGADLSRPVHAGKRHTVRERRHY